jgi:F420-non-reducing hydrogenase iron-sulfur subunit
MSFEPKIIGFLCNWCSYTGADLAGTARLKYPPNILAIRVMCSGRVDPGFVLDAFQKGADGVLICGCHPGDCHYVEGNYKCMRRVPLTLKILEGMGVDKRRLRLEWVSASEGGRFQEVIGEFTEQIRTLGPLRLKDWAFEPGEAGVTHEPAASRE